MVNRRAKMHRTNCLVRRWLEEKGYKAIQMIAHTRFSKDLHFRGFPIDGIATTPNNKLALFQIKSNRNPPKPFREKFKKLGEEFTDIEFLWFNKPSKTTKLTVFTSWNGNHKE